MGTDNKVFSLSLIHIFDSQLKQQAEYQKPTTPGGGSGSGNTPDPKPNPDEGDEEAPDPTV